MVELLMTAVVLAKDEFHAVEVAEKHKHGILRDDADPVIAVCGTVKSLSDLHDGWCGGCIPYGGDTDSTIADLLPQMDA